ncbi:MAG: hypothetical protein QOE01_2821 [Actinomycetota bacterium]|jgi:hypothetical protein|nr:hypothetical protein [Actinomycetota bacterium]
MLLLALEGHENEAVQALLGLLDEWEREDLPLDYAWCVVDALAVLPRERVGGLAIERARTTLAELGATSVLARIDAPQRLTSGPVPGH